MKGLNGILIGFLALVVFSGLVHAESGLNISSYNVDPSPVIPGQYFTLYAYVTNDSPIPLDNVEFNLDLRANSQNTTFPFSLDPTDTLLRNVGNIPAFKTVQVQYRVLVDSKATDGSYTITLKANQHGQTAGAVTYATVNVSSRAPTLTITDSSPTQASIGETTTLKVTLKNTGSSIANDIQVGLSEDRTVTAGGTVVERDIVPLGSANVYISSLGAGESTTVSLPIQINPSASSKAYFIPVTLTFYDSAKTQITATGEIGLKVAGNPTLDAYISDTTPLLVSGSKSKITIDMYNSGLGPAKFVTVDVLPADFFTPIQSQFFIGTIESDDFDSVILNGAVSPGTAPGLHEMKIRIHLKNQFGETQDVEKSLQVKVFSPSEVSQENGGGSPLPLILGLIIVVVGVWWFRFRTPKNGNGKK